MTGGALVRAGAAGPDAGTPEWLERKAEFVVSLAYRQACDVVRVGQVLLEVKKAVGRGRFIAWVEESLPFTVQHARRHMAVARAFAAYQAEQFVRFDPSALYVLAQPTGVIPAVRDHAVQLAEQGTRITHALARELVDAHRPVPDAAPRRGKNRSDAVRKREEEASRLAYEKKLRDDLARETRDLRELAAMGGAFLQAVERFGVFTVTRLEADEEEGGGTVYALAGLGDGPAVRAVDADLRLAFDDLLDAGREKQCPACRKVLPLAAFNRSESHADGRNGRCRQCEKARKARDRQKKRDARKAAGLAPTPPG